MRRKYLFIGAHPDDVEINAGGTIADLVREGHTVSVVVCSYTPHAERGKESLKALKVLGVQSENAYFLGLTEPNLHELLPQFQLSVFFKGYCRVLAQLAYFTFVLVPRLFVHSVRWK